MHCGIGFTICRLHEFSSCIITHAGIGVLFSLKNTSACFYGQFNTLCRVLSVFCRVLTCYWRVILIYVLF